LTVAKENASALQELIDVYQRKIRDGAVVAASSSRSRPGGPQAVRSVDDSGPTGSTGGPSSFSAKTDDARARAHAVHKFRKISSASAGRRLGLEHQELARVFVAFGLFVKLYNVALSIHTPPDLHTLVLFPGPFRRPVV
jgi:hypothetical protein